MNTGKEADNHNIKLLKTCTPVTRKLTLNVDENFIEKAKAYAQKSARILSGLMEKYLKNLVEHREPETKFNDKITRLSGKIQLPATLIS